MCNDTSYCNGAEVCNGAAGCQAGNAIDCSGSNLPGIATCNNNPDNNPFTWDFFAGFNSVCDEVNDICTTGTVTLTNTCDKTLCNAPCETNSHCDDSKSYTTDICVLASCTCSNQISDLKIISEPVTTFTPADEKYTSTYEYDVDAVGPNLGISYTLLQGPSGMTINTVSGLITWVPKEPGIYFVEVKAEDGVLSDTQSYYLQVQSPPKDTLPREKFFIGWIRTNQLVYDEIKAGDLLFVDLSFENIGRENTKYATIRITQPELGISRKLGPFVGPEIDEVMSRGTYLEIPGDAKPGVYTVRISLSDLSGMRRTRHRDFRIV